MNDDQNTKTATVYHARSLWDTHGPRPEWPGDYVAVARVQATGVEEAYRLTQTVDRYWWQTNRAAVEPLFEGEGRRSTSAGDVVVIDGTAWFCEQTGWTAIEETAETPENGRPPNKDRIYLKCHFWAPGPGLCGWEGSASEAGWCSHYERWICPRCGSSDELGIVEEPKGLPACVECRRPAQHRLACGHPICDDCYEMYQDECAACNGRAAWCKLATEPPDTRPVHPVPNATPDEHLEATYEQRTGG